MLRVSGGFMKRFVVVALLVAFAASAAAQTPGVNWSDIIQKGLAWIATNGGTDYRSVPVQFYVAVPPGQMASYAVKLNAAGDASKVLALHSCSQHTMYLNAEYDFNKNFVYQGVLVHELVHHLQCENNMWTSDPCNKERQAYAVQAKFIRWSIDEAKARGVKLNDQQTAQLNQYLDELDHGGEKACAAIRSHF